MGISHSMNKEQVDKVLTQFENTTSAIKSIETKIDRVEGYVKSTMQSRENLTNQTEEATNILDGITDSMNETSEEGLGYLSETLERFADLVDMLQTTLKDLKLNHAPRELKKELGPLLMPVIVLVGIVTLSNCFFGFLLANDPDLSESLSPQAVFGGKEQILGEAETQDEAMNMLQLFAIFHVILIGIAIVYLIFELLRNRQLARRRRRLLAAHGSAAKEGAVGDDGDDEQAAEDLSRETTAELCDIDIPEERPEDRPEQPHTLHYYSALQPVRGPPPLQLPFATARSTPPALSEEQIGADAAGSAAASRSPAPSPASRASRSRSPVSTLTQSDIDGINGIGGCHRQESKSPLGADGKGDGETMRPEKSGTRKKRPSQRHDGEENTLVRPVFKAVSPANRVAMLPFSKDIGSVLRSLGEKAGEMVERRKHHDGDYDSSSPGKMRERGRRRNNTED